MNTTRIPRTGEIWPYKDPKECYGIIKEVSKRLDNGHLTITYR